MKEFDFFLVSCFVKLRKCLQKPHHSLGNHDLVSKHRGVETSPVRRQHLFVSVEGVDDELHHPIDLRLEGKLLGLVSELFHLCHTESIQLDGFLFSVRGREGGRGRREGEGGRGREGEGGGGGWRGREGEGEREGGGGGGRGRGREREGGREGERWRVADLDTQVQTIFIYFAPTSNIGPSVAVTQHTCIYSR